jgi:DNA-binding SARP family transcriptional activator/tetratricopeptide (TPR) repeat protein
MEFRILGPVEVWARGTRVEPGPPRQRGVLAALAVDAGRPVSMETVVDRVWGPAQSDRTRHTLHVYVGRIRKMLDDAGGEARLLLRSGGYVLDVDADRVDALRFRRLVEKARDPGLADAPRAEVLRQALDLWRGTPLADVPGEWAERVREGWTQRRTDVVVAWAQAELRLGRPTHVIGTVSELISENPLVEPMVAVYMRALAAGGRGAEALETYARTQRLLADQLGADPGADLRGLHQAILRGNLDTTVAPDSPAASARPGTPTLPATGAAKASPVAPAQLPLDVYGFTGRARELDHLDALRAGAGEQPTALVLAVLSGSAGVGKTALAVHWAHRVRQHFPDGQLYVNLRGFDPTGAAVAPADAMRGFLDALGAERVPAGLEAQTGLYRSLLVGRRMLVVLDNARDSEQVRPLLPGTPGCFVLITSRSQLPGLVAAEGAHPLAVELLPEEDARQLLTRRMGAARVASDPSAVDAIITGCARLPLALAVVAARAVTNPGFPLASLAGELRRELNRDVHQPAGTDLDAFAGGDLATDVRSVFSWSYRTLSSPAARLFRLLGLHAGPDLTVSGAASLIGWPVRATEEMLTELARAHLVAEHKPGRFTFHDLLRAYATELARSYDEEDARHAAVRRMLDFYLHSAMNANWQLDPSREPVAPIAMSEGARHDVFATLDEAMSWFEAEHAALIAAVRQAEAGGFDAHVWQLAWAVSTYNDRLGHWIDQITIMRMALDATRRLDDRNATAIAHRGLALVYSRLARYDEADTHCKRALEIYRELDDKLGQALGYQNLCWVAGLQRRHREALGYAQRALPLFRELDHTLGHASTLNDMGWFHSMLGNYDEALVACREALALFEKLNLHSAQANTWDTVGFAYHKKGSYSDAVASYEYALELFNELGHRYGHAETLGHLGDTYAAMGSPDLARDAWQRSLATLEELNHGDADQIRAKLNGL